MAGGQLIYALNPEHEGCGCNAPLGYEVFGTGGSLTILAVVLAFSGSKPPKLALVLASRKYFLEGDAYTCIVVDSNGWLHGETVGAVMRKRAFLAHSLELVTAEQMIDMPCVLGGSLDSHMGFPGSQSYLGKHIGKLGPYLSAMAAQVKGHSH